MWGTIICGYHGHLDVHTSEIIGLFIQDNHQLTNKNNNDKNDNDDYPYPPKSPNKSNNNNNDNDDHPHPTKSPNDMNLLKLSGRYYKQSGHGVGS